MVLLRQLAAKVCTCVAASPQRNQILVLNSLLHRRNYRVNINHEMALQVTLCVFVFRWSSSCSAVTCVQPCWNQNPPTPTECHLCIWLPRTDTSKWYGPNNYSFLSALCLLYLLHYTLSHSVSPPTDLI